MGLNLNSSLLLENASDKFNIPLTNILPMDNYYLEALNVIHDINSDMREAHLNFYRLNEQVDVVNENVFASIGNAIKKIFTAIIDAIKKIKDMIVKAISDFIRKIKHKLEEGRLKRAYDNIQKYYDKDQYFDIELYSNTLKNCLVDTSIPTDQLLVNDDYIDDHLVDFSNDQNNHIDTNYTKDQIQAELNNNEGRIHDKVIANKREFAGTADSSYDLESPTGYKQALSDYYIGQKVSRTVSREVAVTAIENLKIYDDIITHMNEVKSRVEKDYNRLSLRISKMRDQALDRINNPAKFGYASETDTTREDEFTAIAKSALQCSNYVNQLIQDHMMAFMVKLECLNTMQKQDYMILDRVEKIVNKQLKPKDEVALDLSLEEDAFSMDEFNESYEYYKTQMFMFTEAYDNLYYDNYIRTNILNEADGDANATAAAPAAAPADNTTTTTTTDTTKVTPNANNNKQSFKDKVARTFELIKNLYVRIVNNLKNIIFKRKKFYDQNEALIKSNTFVFPSQNENLKGWVDYKQDLLSANKFEMPIFDMNNGDLLNKLAAENTFAEYLYQKMGGKPGENSGNFAAKCRSIFTGATKDKPVKEFASEKDKYFDFCKDFLADNGFYKRLLKSSKDLDTSKRNIDAALKSYKPENSDGTETTTTATQTQTAAANTDTTATGAGTTTAGTTTTGAGTTQTATTASFSFDLAGALGIQENAFLTEAGVEVPKADTKDTMKDTIKQASGDTETGLKSLIDKASLFFRMSGDAFGAMVAVSVQAFNQYNKVFTWAVNASKGVPNPNNTPKANNNTNNGGGVADATKAAKATEEEVPNSVPSK